MIKGGGSGDMRGRRGSGAKVDAWMKAQSPIEPSVTAFQELFIAKPIQLRNLRSSTLDKLLLCDNIFQVFF
jgi:hypothetical protein